MSCFGSLCSCGNLSCIGVESAVLSTVAAPKSRWRTWHPDCSTQGDGVADGHTQVKKQTWDPLGARLQRIVCDLDRAAEGCIWAAVQERTRAVPDGRKKVALVTSGWVLCGVWWRSICRSACGSISCCLNTSCFASPICVWPFIILNIEGVEGNVENVLFAVRVNLYHCCELDIPCYPRYFLWRREIRL